MAIEIIQDLQQTTHDKLAFYITGLDNTKTYTCEIFIYATYNTYLVQVCQNVTISRRDTSKTYVYDSYGDVTLSLLPSGYIDNSAEGFLPGTEYGVRCSLKSSDGSVSKMTNKFMSTATIPENDGVHDFSGVYLSYNESDVFSDRFEFRVCGLPSSYADPNGYIFHFELANEYGIVSEIDGVQSSSANLTESKRFIFKNLDDGTTYYVHLVYLDYYINGEPERVYFDNVYIAIDTVDNKDDYYPDFSNVYLSLKSTASTVSVSICGLDEYYLAVAGYKIQYRLYDIRPDQTNAYIDSSAVISVEAGVTETPIYTFKGLNKKTAYYIAARFQYVEYGENKYFPKDYNGLGSWDFWDGIDTSDISLPSLGSISIKQLTSSNQYTKIKLQITNIPETPSGGWKFNWTITSDNGDVVATHTDTVYSKDELSGGTYFDGTTVAWEFSATQETNYYTEVTVSFAPYDAVSGDIWYELDGVLSGGPYTTVLNDDYGGARSASLSLSASYSSIMAILSGLDSSYYNSRSRTIVWTIKDLTNGGGETEYTETLSNYSSSTSKDFTDLEYESLYKITATIHYYCKDGTPGEISFSQSITTKEAESFNFSNISLTVAQGSPSTSVLKATLSGLDSSYPRSDGYVYWSIGGGSYTSSSFSAGASSVAKNFTGLASGSTYTVKAYIQYTENGNVCTSSVVSKDGTTALPAAVLSLTATATKITATISGLDETYSQGGRTAEWKIRPSSTSTYETIETTSIPNNVASISYDYLSLSPATKYYVQVVITFNTGTKTLSGNITTTIRPDEFQWTSTVAKGYELRRHSNGGYYGITAVEWGELLNNINEMRIYFNLSEFPTITLSAAKTQSYPQGFTYPSSGDTFSAIYFNQALAAIAGMYSEIKGVSGVYTDNSVVSEESKLSAECLNNLVSLLNDLE